MKIIIYVCNRKDKCREESFKLINTCNINRKILNLTKDKITFFHEQKVKKNQMYGNTIFSINSKAKKINTEEIIFFYGKISPKNEKSMMIRHETVAYSTDRSSHKASNNQYP